MNIGDIFENKRVNMMRESEKILKNPERKST